MPGVDVSSFQGPPGAWKEPAGPIGFAAVKLSELSPGGAYVSPDAAADWAWLKANGKGRIGYLFGHPSTSAVATAQLFLRTIKPLGYDDADGFCLDLEVEEGQGPWQVAAWGRQVRSLLESDFGRKPILYTYPAFAEAGNCEGLGGYPLWIADPSSRAGHPRVPTPWKTWAIHQYVITGPIDRDIAAWTDRAGMTARVGKPKPPPPKPVTHPVPAADVAHWRTHGITTLAREAAAHHTTPAEILYLAVQAGHKYRPSMAAYIAKGDWDARMPLFVLLYGPKPGFLAGAFR
jgi:hypothetical protein